MNTYKLVKKQYRTLNLIYYSILTLMALIQFPLALYGFVTKQYWKMTVNLIAIFVNIINFTVILRSKKRADALKMMEKLTENNF